MTKISSWLLPELMGRYQNIKFSGSKISSFHIPVNLFDINPPTIQTEHFNYTVKNALMFLVIILAIKKEGHVFFLIVGNRYSGTWNLQINCCITPRNINIKV